MERLTQRYNNGQRKGILVKETYGESGLKTLYEKYGDYPAEEFLDCDEGYLAMEKLATYEDLEEQGKLLRLQFRVGDFVWDDEFKTRCKITGYSFGAAEDYIDDPVSETEVVYYYTNLGGSVTGSFAECEIGKTMFHSKEEAEAALERMQNGINEYIDRILEGEEHE